MVILVQSGNQTIAIQLPSDAEAVNPARLEQLRTDPGQREHCKQCMVSEVCATFSTYMAEKALLN